MRDLHGARVAVAKRAAAAAMVAMAVAGCSWTPPSEPAVELEPIPHAYRFYVSFPFHPSEDGPPHYVTDPSAIAGIEGVVNAKRGGWTNVVHAWGKGPIARAKLEFWLGDGGGHAASVELGDTWIMRGAMLQTIPKEGAAKVLQLIRAAP